MGRGEPGEGAPGEGATVSSPRRNGSGGGEGSAGNWTAGRRRRAPERGQRRVLGTYWDSRCNSISSIWHAHQRRTLKPRKARTELGCSLFGGFECHRAPRRPVRRAPHNARPRRETNIKHAFRILHAELRSPSIMPAAYMREQHDSGSRLCHATGRAPSLGRARGLERNPITPYEGAGRRSRP